MQHLPMSHGSDYTYNQKPDTLAFGCAAPDVRDTEEDRRGAQPLYFVLRDTHRANAENLYSNELLL